MCIANGSHAIDTGLGGLIIILLAFVSITPSIQALESLPYVEDAHLNITQLITKHGYPVEEHRITTQDGYILTVFRIPYSLRPRKNQKEIRRPVLLEHGLFNSATDWIITGPRKSLAYLLADRGYDVWMGNARGNSFSRKHVLMTPEENQFWKFSWHEIGMYDLPATIDYILETSKQEKLYYIGFSQGTTSFFVMASMRPEYNNKVRSMTALAPVAYMSHIVSPLLQFISVFEEGVTWLRDVTQIYEFLPNSPLIKDIARTLCQEQSNLLCKNLLFILSGFSTEQFNKTLLPVIVEHTPAGASTMQLFHYAQGINTGKFRFYDFGLLNNKRLYGTYKPPEYDITKITTPVALHYADNDWLSSSEDVRLLERELPDVIGSFRVPFDSFNHLDFLWAIDAPKLVYKKIMQIMSLY